MSNIKCACQGCKERYVGCHSTCEEYLEYARQNKEYKEKIKAFDESDRLHYAYISGSKKYKKK